MAAFKFKTSPYMDWPIMLIFTYYAMLQRSKFLPIMLNIMLKNKGVVLSVLY